MTSTRWKLAAALGVAGAIAFSIPSAEARGGRNAALGFGIAAGALALGAAAASQPRYHYYDGYYNAPHYYRGYRGAYAYGYNNPYVYGSSPYVYDSYQPPAFRWNSYQ